MVDTPHHQQEKKSFRSLCIMASSQANATRSCALGCDTIIREMSCMQKSCIRKKQTTSIFPRWHSSGGTTAPRRSQHSRIGSGNWPSSRWVSTPHPMPKSGLLCHEQNYLNHYQSTPRQRHYHRRLRTENVVLAATAAGVVAHFGDHSPLGTRFCGSVERREIRESAGHLANQSAAITIRL